MRKTNPKPDLQIVIPCFTITPPDVADTIRLYYKGHPGLVNVKPRTPNK